MKRLVLLAVLAVPVLAHADPFDVLRDTSQRWHYEVFKGKSPSALKKVADAPTATCQIDKVKTDDVLPVAHLSCVADSKPTNGDMSFGGSLGLAVDQDRYLAFDADGVRQVFSGSSGDMLKDRFNASGLAFPAKVTGAWKLRLSGKDKPRIAIDGSVKSVKVQGASLQAWFETGTIGFPDLNERVADAIIPNVGPYQLCVWVHDDREYWCLRMTGYEKR